MWTGNGHFSTWYFFSSLQRNFLAWNFRFLFDFRNFRDEWCRFVPLFKRNKPTKKIFVKWSSFLLTSHVSIFWSRDKSFRLLNLSRFANLNNFSDLISLSYFSLVGSHRQTRLIRLKIIYERFLLFTWNNLGRTKKLWSMFIVELFIPRRRHKVSAFTKNIW